MEPPRETQHARPAERRVGVLGRPLLVRRRHRRCRRRRRLVPLPQRAAFLGLRPTPLSHEAAVADRGADGERPGGDRGDAPEDGGADVEDALESAGWPTDANGVEDGAVAVAGEETEVADEEADGSDEGVGQVPSTGGVDLDGVGAGGIVGEEARVDAEEELIVPGGVLAADAVDQCAELDGGVDPDDSVGLQATVAAWRLEALSRDQVDLQREAVRGGRLHLPRAAADV